ncbi:hypothetical protein [Bacillus marinisedimentorum]|uniref:hypothetical protein n=1 Tax=Bacillus marinisedimentorum TaxID=1821260 RepID=UPI000872BC45|nr:hypothetical protein [Bacillus marinisedimentorum]
MKTIFLALFLMLIIAGCNEPGEGVKTKVGKPEAPLTNEKQRGDNKLKSVSTLEEAIASLNVLRDADTIHIEPFQKGVFVFSRKNINAPEGERQDLILTTIRGNADIGWEIPIGQPTILRCEKAALCSDAASGINVADPDKWTEKAIPKIVFGVINDDTIAKADINVRYNGKVIPLTVIDTNWKPVFFTMTDEEIDEMTVTGYDKDGHPLAEAVW